MDQQHITLAAVCKNYSKYEKFTNGT